MSSGTRARRLQRARANCDLATAWAAGMDKHEPDGNERHHRNAARSAPGKVRKLTATTVPTKEPA
eukprot:14421141-Alexandrium_andersonii.AAC.1